MESGSSLEVFNFENFKMPRLNYTKVFRGGLSSNYLTETFLSTYFYISSMKKDEDWESGLRLEIAISSADGGITQVYIDIGRDEFSGIFESIANEIPETASLFSKCTTIAINKNNKNQYSDDD